MNNFIVNNKSTFRDALGQRYYLFIY